MRSLAAQVADDAGACYLESRPHPGRLRQGACAVNEPRLPWRWSRRPSPITHPAPSSGCRRSSRSVVMRCTTRTSPTCSNRPSFTSSISAWDPEARRGVTAHSMITITITHGHDHSHGEHGHSHGLVDRSIVRSRAGVKAVAISLAFSAWLRPAAGDFHAYHSVALLADSSQFGDALTAVPSIAFFQAAFAVRIAISPCRSHLHLCVRRAVRDGDALRPPPTSRTSGATGWRNRLVGTNLPRRCDCARPSPLESRVDRRRQSRPRRRLRFARRDRQRDPRCTGAPIGDPTSASSSPVILKIT